LKPAKKICTEGETAPIPVSISVMLWGKLKMERIKKRSAYGVEEG